jgi:hypothetical protein
LFDKSARLRLKLQERVNFRARLGIAGASLVQECTRIFSRPFECRLDDFRDVLRSLR